MKGLTTLMTACALTASSALLGTDTSPRVISADLQGETSPNPRMYNMCVGAGRANEGLRADWQRQFKIAHDECGFRYIRFHGLLTDDMGVILWEDGKMVYNWQYIDELFDFILDTGMTPFVELGFMPEALASGDAKIFWWEGNVTPPKDPEQWKDLIEALLTHWTERYGEEEILKWYFEVWNEPNLSGFWTGNPEGLDDEAFQEYAREKYFELYQATAEAVKNVNPRYRVGGPATAGNAWIPETIQFCEENDVPLDFITTHNYAVTAGYLDETATHGTVFAPNRDAMISEIKGSRQHIEGSSMPGLELHYTEWSSSYTPRDPIHDSYHSAAFILNKVHGVGDSVQSMSYWTFTDIFEESAPRATPFHGGFGMTNYQDIHKPSYFAYKFLNQLGDTTLACDDFNSWITTDGKGNVQALFWDFTIDHPGDHVLNQQFYNQILPPKEAAPVQLELKNLTPGNYKLTGYRVGFEHNDAYTAYMKMGAPNQLTRDQAKALREIASGAPCIQEIITIGDDGNFTRDIPMMQNDAVLMTLEKM